jgi:hypothetical protein
MMVFLLSKKLVSALVTIAAASLIGWRAYARLSEENSAGGSGRIFYDVARGAEAQFVVRGTKDLHLASYLVLSQGEETPARYSLQLSFYGPQGALRERRSYHLSVDTNDSGSGPAGPMKLARVRVVRLQAPADTTLLKVECPQGRILVQASALTTRHPSLEALLMRSGVPRFLFTTDELEQVRSQRFMRLSGLGKLSIVQLPYGDPVPMEEIAVGPGTPGPLWVGPSRALVFNVVGPGAVSFTLPAVGAFDLSYLGVGGAGSAEVESGHAALSLPAGPSSIILRPREGSSSEVRLETQRLRPLDPSSRELSPSEHWAPAWMAQERTELRFPMYGVHALPLPVRLLARALDPRPGETHSLHWQFLDERGHRLREGKLQADSGYDPFAAVVREGRAADVGVASELLLSPPKGTAILWLELHQMAVEVDTLLEQGAEADHLPPYDVPLRRGLHWQDVPSRAPRWLMLAPLGTEVELHHLRTSVLRMPRIEQYIPAVDHGPWISLRPEGAPPRAQLAEASRVRPDLTNPLTVMQTGGEAMVVIAQSGRYARRVFLTCDVAGKLGGQLALIVDGKRRASAPILTGMVRLEAPVSAGVHHVRVESPRPGQCIVEGQLEAGATLVRRQIYRLAASPKRGLSVNLSTRSRHPLRVYYALYSESPEGRKDPQYEVYVDGVAHPKRPVPPADPSGLHKADAASLFTPLPMLHKHRVLWRVAQSSVLLGPELSGGHHRIRLGVLAPGRYWARFWIHGKRHPHQGAESWTSSEELAHSESSD